MSHDSASNPYYIISQIVTQNAILKLNESVKSWRRISIVVIYSRYLGLIIIVIYQNIWISIRPVYVLLLHIK